MAQADKYVSDGVSVWDVTYDTNTGAELYRTNVGSVAQWAGNPNVTADTNTAAQNQALFGTVQNSSPQASNFGAAVTAAPTPQQIIAQTYVAAGYVPPDSATLDDIVSGVTDAADVPLVPAMAPAAAAFPAATVAPAPSVSPPPSPQPVALATQNVVASVSAPAIGGGGMTGVFDDTPAFTIGNDANGNAIMQLVDAAGNLVQWTLNRSAGSGYIVPPFYVIAAPNVNETRLIGMDANGNPVFQMIDSSKNLLQWTENANQIGFVVPPFYVSVGTATTIAPSTAAPPANVGGGVTTNPGGAQSVPTAPGGGAITGGTSGGNASVGGGANPANLSRPQIQVGTTTAGWPIWQIGDSAGVTKQWIANPGPPAQTVDLVNAPTYGVLYLDSVTAAAVAKSGGGTVTAAVAATGSGTLLAIAAAVALVLFLSNRKNSA